MNLLTNELDAINLMLSNIGESPVNTIEDSGVIEVVTARKLLDATNTTVQTIEWDFNTESGITLTPSYPEKEITLPSNTLRVDVIGQKKHRSIVQRGNRLYDKDKHTFQFDKAITVELVIRLPFEELPQAAKEYVVIRASRVFQQRTIGSKNHSLFNEADERNAWNELVAADTRNGDYNILTGNYTTASAINREM